MISTKRNKNGSGFFETALPYMIVWVFLCFVALIAFSFAMPRDQKKYRGNASGDRAAVEYLPTNNAATSVTIAQPTQTLEAVTTEVNIK